MAKRYFWQLRRSVLMHSMPRKKPPSFLQGTVSEKIKKNLQTCPFLAVLGKHGYVMRFFLIFSEAAICKELGFLCYIQRVRTLLLSYQKQFLAIFFIFSIIRGDTYDSGGGELTSTKSRRDREERMTVLEMALPR